VSLFVASVGFGLVTASVLAIAAVGFTLQFGVTDVLNLAYGAVMILGAFLAYLVNSHGTSVWLGLLLSVAACSVVSVLLNTVVYTPFQRRGASPITMVIVSLGMTLIIEFGIEAVAGGVPVSYTMGSGSTFTAGGLTLTGVQLVIMALAVLTMAGVHVLLRDAGRADHRPGHRGQRRVHPGRLQVRDRVRCAARHARGTPDWPARRADMTRERGRG